MQGISRLLYYASIRVTGRFGFSCFSCAHLLMLCQALVAAVQKVVGPTFDVRERLGRIEIKGDHTAKLQTWLQKAGF